MNVEWYIRAFPSSLTVYNSMKERLSFLRRFKIFFLTIQKNKNRFHPATLKKQGVFSGEF